MVKKNNQVIRYLEFHVNMRYKLQPVHNELTLCVQWNSNFVQQSVQGALVPRCTKSVVEKLYF